MGTIGFYIAEADKELEVKLRNLEGGVRSRFILECIKANSREVINRNIEAHRIELAAWENILEAVEHKSREAAAEVEALKTTREDFIAALIENSIDIRDIAAFRTYVTARAVREQLKDRDIEPKEVIDRYQAALDMRRAERLEKIAQSNKKEGGA